MASTQLVIATSALLTLIMLIVQLGMWLHASHVVHAAAQEGARAARVETGTPDAGTDRVAFHVIASDTEHRLVTSSPADLTDADGAGVVG